MVCFGTCRLDLDARRLFRESREIQLSPKAFELLKQLVECRPRALSKSDLLERVWPGIFVSDNSLARVVNQVRNAVDDSAQQQRIIRTVQRYGYAFVAETVASETPQAPAEGSRARCWLACGRREFPLDDGQHIVGRAADEAVRLASPKVSRRHARLTVKGLRAIIEDLSSKNGTSVRGTRVRAPLLLEPGDEIQVGPFTLVFQVSMEVAPTETDQRLPISTE